MAQSEYSYYSVDDHHDNPKKQGESGELAKPKRAKSGMTEKDVVPASLPDSISDVVDRAKDEDAESDWSAQVNEANQKSGFTTGKGNNDAATKQETVGQTLGSLSPSPLG